MANLADGDGYDTHLFYSGVNEDEANELPVESAIAEVSEAPEFRTFRFHPRNKIGIKVPAYLLAYLCVGSYLHTSIPAEYIMRRVSVRRRVDLPARPPARLGPFPLAHPPPARSMLHVASLNIACRVLPI